MSNLCIELKWDFHLHNSCDMAAVHRKFVMHNHPELVKLHYVHPTPAPLCWILLLHLEGDGPRKQDAVLLGDASVPVCFQLRQDLHRR